MARLKVAARGYRQNRRQGAADGTHEGFIRAGPILRKPSGV